VEGTTSMRDLLGRGVGVDTMLVIGESEEESEGGSTIIEVSAKLHKDKVDEFPVEFDEGLVALTEWLCARGTTTAQFFVWADVDASGEMDLFEFANALKAANIADLPPWDISKLVDVMDINNDGKINLPELDIALMNIRKTLEIEFVPYEEEEVEEEEAEDEETEETSDAPSEAELKKMKKAELVEMAESMDLDSSGTKADIIGRITKA
jgi:Ca2+-binding EF-hand superfamily protein